MILAVDPGKDKFGLAVLENDGRIVDQLIVPAQTAEEDIEELSKKFPIEIIVIGESGSGRNFQKKMIKHKTVLFPEKDTTWQARRRYWQENTPRGWLRLMPTSLRIPPRPVDDYAAVIIGERYLKSCIN